MNKVRIGIDIGGTNTRIGVVRNNKIIDFISFKTNIKDYRITVDKINDGYLIYKKKYSITSIGLCMPGPIDIKTGAILESPNLPGWNGINIKNVISNKINFDIAFENDANAQALAMQQISAPKSKVFVFFTISTGIGCGIIIDGKIFQGAHGFAAEVANINVSDEKSGYGVLSDGSVESISSGKGLENKAKKINVNNTVKNIFDNEELICIRKCGEKSLSKLFNATISLLDPDCIAFSGSVAINNKEYVNNSLKMANQKLFTTLKNKQKIIFADLKTEYGIIGASLLKVNHD